MSSDNKLDDGIDPTWRFMVARLGMAGMDKVLALTGKPIEEHTFGTYRPDNERIQWTIHGMDEGLRYAIKNVERGTYLSFQGTSFLDSKEPFAWIIEPHKRDDGVFRFTAPDTTVYLDFVSESSKRRAHENEDRSGRYFGGGYGYQSYAYSPSHYRSK